MAVNISTGMKLREALRECGANSSFVVICQNKIFGHAPCMGHHITFIILFDKKQVPIARIEGWYLPIITMKCIMAEYFENVSMLDHKDDDHFLFRVDGWLGSRSTAS